MIRSYADPDTETLFLTGKSRRYSSSLAVARRKLQVMDNTARLEDLAQPPGNRLEALKGDRAGQHSVRINEQYRICFAWNGEPEHVEIVDCH